MPDQIVITEKARQAKDVRAAVGSRYGSILAAEGHLLDLLEPGDVVPAWKQWTPILLRPDGLYGTRPASGGNKATKLKAIYEALRTAKRVWLATDCDREGQLIGQERHPISARPSSEGWPQGRQVGSVRVCASKCSLRSDRRARWIRRRPVWPLRSQCDGESGACGCWRKHVDEAGSGDEGGFAIHRSLDRTGQLIVGT